MSRNESAVRVERQQQGRIASHSASTSDRMWLDSSIVRPRARSLVLRAFPEHGLHQRVESLDVGSSRISSSASEASAATSATFCRFPLEYAARLLRRIEIEALQQLGPALGVQPAAQPAEQVDDFAAGQVRPQGHRRAT